MPRWKHRHHHHWHQWDDGMRRGWILRWRLQRRIFFTLAAAIAFTIGIVMVLLRAMGLAIHKPPSHFAWGVFFAFLLLWTFSRFMARRIASPLSELERMARAIGSGNFHERIDMHQRSMRMGEFPVLGHALNDLADRLEKQLGDQRALLATVSHEIRTPLARMRLLVEFARDCEDAEKRETHLAEVDKEIVGVDALVSELLAASRIDFGALRRTELIAYDLAKQAIERVSPDTALEDRTEGATFLGDATLVARAIGNLLENAKRHAGGAVRMRILERGARIAFEVDDDGPGFAAGEEEQVFQPFYRGKSGGESSVGLGLALVKRIAEAHGGRAYAQNREGGGARVGIELARA
jgi:two-component system, OmpR family, sensor kinase